MWLKVWEHWSTGKKTCCQIWDTSSGRGDDKFVSTVDSCPAFWVFAAITSIWPLWDMDDSLSGVSAHFDSDSWQCNIVLVHCPFSHSKCSVSLQLAVQCLKTQVDPFSMEELFGVEHLVWSQVRQAFLVMLSKPMESRGKMLQISCKLFHNNHPIRQSMGSVNNKTTLMQICFSDSASK